MDLKGCEFYAKVPLPGPILQYLFFPAGSTVISVNVDNDLSGRNFSRISCKIIPFSKEVPSVSFFTLA